MTQHSLNTQRRLLLVVLAVVILLPLFLFLQGRAMNRRLADKFAEGLRDEVLKQRDELMKRAEPVADSIMYYMFSLSERGPAKPAMKQLSTVIGIPYPSIKGQGSMEAYTRRWLSRGGPSGGSSDATTVRFFAYTPEQVKARIFEALLRGRRIPFPAYGSNRNLPTDTEKITALVGNLTKSNNQRLLFMSLAGTALLLGLGSYIVVLSERGRKLESQLERDKGLAYVGTLAAGLAHEIRNPLSSVKMNVQMIEQKMSSLASEQHSYLTTKVDRILLETTRLERSMNEFLRFARPAPLNKKSESFNAVVDEAVDFLAAECAQANVEIKKEYAKDIPEVSIDRSQFVRALRNLIINARQALDSGGVIRISTCRNGSSVEVAVEDNGPGLCDEIGDNIFDVFYTTKANGTGLGLNIVKQIVEAHGGKVSVGKPSEDGAAFTLSIPFNNGD